MLLITLSSCNKSNDDNTCDPDDTFCNNNNNNNNSEVVTLADDPSENYSFDSSISNKDASANYEIFVRSFYDSNGDGIGDLNGVKEKLPYLSELGVKNLWLMPFNPSPTYHGYDVTDYYSINPDYGTMDDFTNLVVEAKKYNIGILMDLVLNHCSSQNPWFIESYKDYISNNTASDSKANWFNWSNKSLSGYNQYAPGVYYESRFSYTMPDFNLDNEAVRTEIDHIGKFWLEKGLAGFRLDAVLYYYSGDDTKNISFLKWLKEDYGKYNKDCYIVGEAWTNQSVVNEYYCSSCDSFFSFPTSLAAATNGSIVSTVKSINSAMKFSEYIEENEAALKTINPNAVSSYFLSNHDMDRSSNNLSNYYAKNAASLTYLLPGTPYIYYGEEIGLLGVRKTSPDDQSDVRRRLPLIWSKLDKTGECVFPESNRQDLSSNTQVKDGVIDQLNTNYSLTNHYKKVLNIRNKYSFIKNATYTNLVTTAINNQNTHVLVYKLTYNDQAIIVVDNFDSLARKINIGDISNKILDSINTTKKIPVYSNGNLSIGGNSTVILDVK